MLCALLAPLLISAAVAQVNEIPRVSSTMDFFGGFEEVTSKGPESYGAQKKCGDDDGSGVRKACVPYNLCNAKTGMLDQSGSVDGYGIIDIRFGASQCPNALEKCCIIPDDQEVPEPQINTPPPVDPSKKSFCGVRNGNGVDFQITGNSMNEAEYGEFPWMVAVLKRNYDPSVDKTLALCGGSLITPGVVLTGAHCVYNLNPSDIKIRAGEWDTQTTYERLPYQERDVARIIVHEEFNPKNLINDVALLILDGYVSKADNVGTICLPSQGQVSESKNCFASGWGKDKFGKAGLYQVILKKIELPLVDHASCQKALRSTRLGAFFELHKSFVCAGGEKGKDTCTGDGGGPLVCPDPKDPTRYQQVGIVAWGIGCGEHLVPGVYANVALFREWVDSQLERLNISPDPYVY